MSTTIQVESTLTVINCGECGGMYAIGERYYEQCRDHGRSWTCPYCKTGWGFVGRGRVKELEAQVQRERQRRDQAEAEAKRQREAKARVERSLAAQKGVTTRIKNRVHNGVCPCCKRHFANLERHMQNQHPEFVEQA